MWGDQHETEASVGRELSLACWDWLQGKYTRGLTFSEFVSVVMEEPPKGVRGFKELAGTVRLMMGTAGGAAAALSKGLVGRLKAATAAAAAEAEEPPLAAAAAAEEQAGPATESMERAEHGLIVLGQVMDDGDGDEVCGSDCTNATAACEEGQLECSSAGAARGIGDDEP